MNEVSGWIPENLDLEQLEKEHIEKFTGNKKLRIVNVVVLLEILRKRRSIGRKKMIEKKLTYTNLSSKLLEEVIYNYNHYVEFLSLAGVIESDGKYVVGEKCMGFKYTSMYSGKRLKPVVMRDKRAAKAIKRQLALYTLECKKNTEGYEHLTGWFDNGKLRIDVIPALKWIDDDVQDKINCILDNEDIVKDEKMCIDNAIDAGEDFKTMVRSFNSKEGDYKISGYGKRFYNKISNLKKGLRPFITYDGEELVEVDLKNSQPFLLLNILNKSFWEPNADELNPTLNLKSLSDYLYNSIVYDGGALYNTISMFLKNKELKESISSKNYKEWVLEGSIYEEIEKHFQPLFIDGFNERPETKVEFLRILFSDPKKHGFDLYEPCIEFGYKFPYIYELTTTIQLIKSNLLSLILQRVESFLVLEVVCKRIHKLHPMIPLFTLHDSILTTKGNEGIVQEIMLAEINRWTGFTPQVEMKDLHGKKIAA